MFRKFWKLEYYGFWKLKLEVVALKSLVREYYFFYVLGRIL